MSVRQTCQYQYGKHVYIKVRNQILCARKFNVPKSKKLGERLKTLDRWDLTALQTLQNGSELLPRAKRYLYSKTRHLFNTWQEIQEHIHKNMAKHEAMKCHEVPWSAMKCHGASNFILWHFRKSTPSISIPPPIIQWELWSYSNRCWNRPQKENCFGFKLIVGFKTLRILLRFECQHFPSPSACPEDKTCTWLKWTIHWWSALKQSWISTGPVTDLGNLRHWPG